MDDRLLLVQSGGREREAARAADVAAYLAPASVGFVGVLSWGVIARGSDVLVTLDDFRAERRRSFTWREFMLRCASTLAAVRDAGPSSEIHDNITRWALADDWPAAIKGWTELIEGWQNDGRAVLVASEQGVLSMLADALARPWEAASNRLRDGYADARFARLAMVAHDVYDATPHEPAAPTDAYISQPLLGVGRLRERSNPLATLVRAHELYVELLPRWLPDAEALFEGARGVPLMEWLCDATLIANMCFQALKPGSGHAPVLDLRAGSAADVVRLRKVAHGMSLDSSGFMTELGRLGQKDVAPGLAFAPIRISPLLRDGENVWVVLHADFLMTAVEEGPWYTVADALRARSTAVAGEFRTNFGEAFQEYVGRVLIRCSEAFQDAAVARIPEAEGQERSDFAWRVGGDLVLVEVKRASVASHVLMGAPGVAALLDKMAGKACSQLLTTREALAEWLPGVASKLGVASDWVPRRAFGLVVHHRPLFMWFATGATVLRRCGVQAAWSRQFSAVPGFVDVAELELFEAAPGYLTRWLDAQSADHPIAYAGVRTFLSDAAYSGSGVARRVADKGAELLAVRRAAALRNP